MSDKSQFKPGSFGCHEALHMAAFLTGAVSECLCDHPSVKDNPEWLEIANRAFDNLMALYQAIGSEHLTK